MSGTRRKAGFLLPFGNLDGAVDMARQLAGFRWRFPFISAVGVALLLACHGVVAADVVPVVPAPGPSIETCAEGAVGGLVTVSIAAVSAFFAEVSLPAYPVLLGIGLGVGCAVRVAGSRAKDYVLGLWYAGAPISPVDPKQPVR